MPCSGWDENGIAGADLTNGAIDVHDGDAFEQEIDFFADAMVMPRGDATCGQARFGQALFFHRCIRAIENASDGRTIDGDERLLIGKLLNGHSLNSAGKLKEYKTSQKQLCSGAFPAISVAQPSIPMSHYQAAPERYDTMQFRHSGNSGLQLPAISLGLWHNFGGVDSLENGRAMCRTAFDLGITHFDLANNYGPPAGSAEENFARILEHDLQPFRDELIISTKAGYNMWPGPYGARCSRKSMLASLDQSLKRMQLEYVDIYYAHRWDDETPLEETMGALEHAVRVGKALYVGVSSYSPEQTTRAAAILRSMGIAPLIHQPRYSIFERAIEDGLLSALETAGMGCIVFSPLAQGMLTDKYLDGIPLDSRALRSGVFLKAENITEAKLSKIRSLNDIANQRSQSLAQMALAWCLRHKQVTSVLIGASKSSQITDCVNCLRSLTFSESELFEIDKIMAG